MSVRTSKASYRQHEYSGSRKSLKRVRSGIRRYYAEGSRQKIWRSEETKKKPVNEGIVIDNSIITQNTQPRTYARVKPKIRLEDTYSAPSTSTVTAEPVVEPLEMRPERPDPEIDPFQLIEEPGPNKCLSGNMKTEKLSMCRICLVENVRMHVVVDKSLQELYEKLTDVPFVTEDGRPLLACSFCCARIKQCARFQRKCLEAEQLFAQMLDVDHEPNPLIKHGQLEIFGGLIQTPMVHISIDVECQEESDIIKQELPAACERQDDIIEPNEEYPSEELELTELPTEDIPPHHSEADSEDDGSFMEFKTEVEDEQAAKKRKAWEMKWMPVVKIVRLDLRATKLGETIIDKQRKNTQLDLETIQDTQSHMSKLVTNFKEPFKRDQRNSNQVKKLKQRNVMHASEKIYICDICQRCFNGKGNLIRHIRIHTGEKFYKCDICQRCFIRKDHLVDHIHRHTGEKPHKCEICQRCFIRKGHLIEHIRIHTGEKPYKCEICQRSFTHTLSLKRHIRQIHTGETPFKCEICQRSFTQTFSLKQHIRQIHTGETPVKCHICQRSFTRNHDLKRHIQIHTGDKYY